MRYVQKTTGTWTELKQKLKTTFPVLSDDDVAYEDGKYEDMLYAIGSKLGKTHH